MTRKELLEKLITMSVPLPFILGSLREYPWDSEALIVLESVHVKHALLRFLNAEITSQDLEDWANAIEGRDDIDYTSNLAVKAIIGQLANPELYLPLTLESVDALLQRII